MPCIRKVRSSPKKTSKICSTSLFSGGCTSWRGWCLSGSCPQRYPHTRLPNGWRTRAFAQNASNTTSTTIIAKNHLGKST